MKQSEIELLYDEVKMGRKRLDQLNNNDLVLLKNFVYTKDKSFSNEQPISARLPEIQNQISNYNFKNREQPINARSENVRARYTGTPPTQAKVGQSFIKDVPNLSAVPKYIPPEGQITMGTDGGIVDRIKDAARVSFFNPETFKASLGEFIGGGLKGASLGLTESNLIPNNLRDAEELRKIQLGKREAETINITGEIVGSLLPGLGALNIASKAITKLPNMGRYATEAVRGGLSGGIFESAREGIDAAVGREDKPLSERFTNIAVGTAAGALLDPAAVFIGDKIKILYNKLFATKPKVETQLQLPEGKKMLALPQGNSLRNQGQTNKNIFPVKPTNFNKAKTDSVIQQEGNFERELVGKQIRKPLGLPEGKPFIPTKGKIVNPVKELQQIYTKKLEDFRNYVLQKHSGQPNNPEQLLNDWSEFADKNDPDIFTAFDWAYNPSVKTVKEKVIKTFGSLENAKGAVLRGREYLQSREAAGLSSFVNKKPQSVINEAIGPIEKFAIKNKIPKENQGKEKVFANLPIKEKPIPIQELNEQATVTVPSATKFIPPVKEKPVLIVDQERELFNNKVKRFFGRDIDTSNLTTEELFDLSNQIDKQTSGIKRVKPSSNQAVKETDLDPYRITYTTSNPQKNDIINELNRIDDELSKLNFRMEEEVKMLIPLLKREIGNKPSIISEVYEGGGVTMQGGKGIKVSNNPLWYQQWYKKNQRTPRNADFEEVARDMVFNGKYGGGGESFQIKKAIEEVRFELNNELKKINTFEKAKNINQFNNNTKLYTPNNDEQSLKYGIDLPQPKGKKVEPITIQEVMNTLRNDLGVTIRKGRMKTRKSVLGFFRVKSEVVRSKVYGDIQVIAHEVGHALDKRYGFENAGFDQELLRFIAQVSPNHLKNYQPQDYVPEAIAEYFRQYFIDRNVAQKLAPNFSNFIQSNLSKKDLLGLEKSTNAIERWIEQGAYERLANKIDYEGKESNPTLRHLGEKIYENVVDKNYPLAKFEMLITKQTEKGKGGLTSFLRGKEGTLLDAKQSPYKLARLYEGTPEKIRLFIDENLMPMFDKLDQFGIQVKELTNYATAKHAGDLELKGIQSGFTKQEINATLNKLETPNMLTAHKMLMDFNDKLRKIMLDSGLINADTYNALVEKHPNYVPFYRFFDEKDEVEGFKGLSKTFVDVNAPIKKIVGSDRPILNPLESMIKNAAMTIDAAERNKVGQSLYRLADSDGAGAFVERLGTGQSVSRENIATVLINGEKQQLQFNSPELYNAYKNLDLKSAGFVEDILTIPAQVIRNAITATPSFWLRSMMLDEFHAYLVSNEVNYIPYVDLFRGFFTMAKRPDLYKRWVNSGGAYGTFFSQDRKYLQAVLESLKTDKKGLQKAAQYIRITPQLLQEIVQFVPNKIEEARRITIFKDLVERKGKTDEEAALIARDLIDFQKRGAMMHGLSRTTPFLNPNIQGKDKTLRSFINSPVKFAVRGLVGLTIPTIALYAFNKRYANEEQQKKINDAPEWMTNTNFLLAVPNTDIVARIPKPFDVSWAFANSAEQVMKFIDQNDPQSLNEFLKTNFVEDTIPQLLSPILPIYEVNSNYNFHSQSPIVNDTLAKRMPKDQYDVYTAKLAKLIGQISNQSPKNIEYLMNAYGGDYARYGNALFDSTIGKSIYSNDPKRPASDLFLKAFTNRFAVSQEYQPKSVSKFYDEYEKLEKQINSAKFNKESAPYGKFKAMQKYFYQMQDIQKRRRSIELSKTLSETEKREKLNQIRESLSNVAKRGNKVMEGR